MAKSARKPYLRLKKSLVDFFRAPIVFIKEINQKFSEFEKPYQADEYPSMHIGEWPSWDWGRWGPDPLQPTYQGPFPFNPEEIGRGPGSNFETPPEDEGRRCDQGGCSVIEWPPSSVEAGEFYALWISTNAYPVVSVSVDGPAIFPSDCVGKTVPPGFSLCGVYCGGWVQVSEGAQEGDWITITLTTADGESCGTFSVVEGKCDPAAIIGYTTLGMQVDEEQTLTASLPGESYTWAVAAGGGSVSPATGNSTVYTAPSENPECAVNPTINLLCEEVVIDSITIAINEYTTQTRAYHINDGCVADGQQPAGCSDCGGNSWCCFQLDYYCNGTMYLCSRLGTHTSSAACAALGLCAISGVTDVRNAGMITDGCCPAAFI